MTGTQKTQNGQNDVCEVDGCDNLKSARRKHYCEKHYMRMYRNGTLERIIDVPIGTEHITTRGYMLMKVERDHPLCQPSNPGWAYSHRVIAYNHLGSHPQPCHHCGKVSEWRDLVIDHLDDNPLNNDVENIVPACPSCNNHREEVLVKLRLTIRASHNYYTHEGETLHVVDWAKRLGVTTQSIMFRLKNWPLDKVFSTPRRNYTTKKAQNGSESDSEPF